MITVELTESEAELLYQIVHQILKGKVKEFDENCKSCGEPIKMVNLGFGWKPRDIKSGTLHKCGEYKQTKR